MKIQTVNQLISVFKDISTRHYQINGFGIGDNWENGTSEKMHPVLWINPTTATMPSTDNGYKTFEIDFEVRVFDLVNKDESNENEVLSDCIDILKDIITEFKGHPYYVNSQLNIIDDINFEAFTEEFDEEVSGWVCEISLMTPVLTSFCGIPSAEITGFEFPGADCPEVNVLCPVFVEDVTGVYPIVVTTTGTTKEVSIVGGGLSDTFVISGEYDNGTLTLTRNDDVDVIVTGFDTGGDNDYTTSATLSGNIITFDRTDTVGAYSVDLTTAINSAPDKFVSSGAYDEINNKIVLTLNDASTVDIDTSAIGGGGGGIDNVTTAEKSALSPSTGDFVYDTDLNSLQRYDGSNWVDVAKGYGLIEVITNSDNSIPKYFTDLQTALDTCKTSGSINTVTLKSNITLSSQINVTTANGFAFSEITLNGNGFKVTFDDASSDDVIDFTVAGKKITLLNLTIERLNGTGSHYAIYNNGAKYLNMVNCYAYCENGGSLFLAANNSDLGNSTFETNGSVDTLFIGNVTVCKHFTAISNGSGSAVDNNHKASYFICENTSTGEAYNGDNNSEGSFFTAKSNTGDCVDNGIGLATCSNFRAISVSGIAVKTDSNGIFYNFYAETGGNVALQCFLAYIKNGICINDSSSSTAYSVRCIEIDNLFCKNNGSGYALDSFQNTSFTNYWNKITAISVGGIGATIRGNSGQIMQSTFISKYNNAGGHALKLQTNGCELLNCVYDVVNASANGVNSTSSVTAKIANSTFKGPATPINANVTVTASIDLGNGNRQI